MLRTAILIAALMSLASCELGQMQPDGKPVRDIWESSAPDLRIEDPSPLKAEKEIPILSAPEVFAVYVPSHVDRTRDILVGEHWVFFKLKDGDWFIDRGLEPEPPASGDAAAELMTPLRAMEGMNQAVVPWKERP